MAAASVVYTLFTFETAVVLVGMLAAVFVASLRAGQIIHDGQVKTLLSLPLHRFTPSFLATITTRLSQDLYLIDLQWPQDLFNFLLGFLSLLSSLVLMIVPAPFLLIPFVSTTALSVILVYIYTPTSRNLRHIDLTAKDPLLSFYSELQDGVDTILTFDVGSLTAGTKVPEKLPSSSSGSAAPATRYNVGAIEQGLTLIDLAQLPYFYLEASRKWLQTLLNLIAALVNTCLIIILVATRGKFTAGSIIGVSLLQTVSLSSTLNQVILSWTEAQIASVAIDRARKFTLQEFEADIAVLVVDQQGSSASRTALSPAIEFRKYSARYHSVSPAGDRSESETNEGSELKLKSVNLIIEKGEHVVICGPSGCGKSTLLHALAGTIDHVSGSLLLNGIDASHKTLFHRRSRIVLVPQSGFQLLGKTLRENLIIGTHLDTDNAETISDQELHEVLRATQLHIAVSAIETGLDTVLETSTFSPGQWALLNMARCFLIARRRECIVLLDEVNASLDRETDELLQNVIRDQLKGQTVIAVMHKLDAGHAGGWSKTVTMKKGEVARVA